MNASLLLLLAQPMLAQSDFRIVDLRSGESVSLAVVAADLAKRDVVFLGELHDNAVGHRVHHDLLGAMHAAREDVVLSMEMFERDVQGVLDDYLAGRIDVEAFREHARPWGDHDAFYQPFLDVARQHGLDVIAGNAPRPIARKVARGEEPTIADRQFLPRRTSSPDGEYRELFEAAMGGHEGTDDTGALDRYFESQCLKDDAMAEAITDYLAVRPHRNPLVVHVCGAFHSDHGRGTVLRVLSRRPLLHVGVVSMEAVDNVAEFEPEDGDGRAHYLIVVPELENDESENDDPGE